MNYVTSDVLNEIDIQGVSKTITVVYLTVKGKGWANPKIYRWCEERRIYHC
jgi:hypothetical protein